MNAFLLLAPVFLLLGCATSTPEPALESAQERTWIEPGTGHRATRLSTQPGTASFYFHQNAYTAEGDLMAVSVPGGYATINLLTGENKPLVSGRLSSAYVGGKTRTLFYLRDREVVCATHLDTGETREIGRIPPEFRMASGLALNADETVLAGSLVEAAGLPPGFTPPASGAGRPAGVPGEVWSGKSKGLMMEERWAARLPMRLWTMDIRTGAFRTFHPSNDWLNHVQFSPADPGLLMFCHEGPWHKVDRIWLIRADGSGLRQVHKRQMDMEIGGHEFFSKDGRTVWYDLQTPKGKRFWLAGFDLATGETRRFGLTAPEWSVHFNVSPGGALFAGDGGGPASVAAPDNGQWLYLFRPKEGRLESEKLFDLSKHDYKLEPNVTFTPDGKRLVFVSNREGTPHVYAVEIEKH